MLKLSDLLPQECELCLGPSSGYLCPECTRALPTNTFECLQCAIPLKVQQSLCGDCLKSSKPFTRTICPWLYQHPLDQLIRQYKQRNPNRLIQLLLPQFVEHLRREYQGQDWPELLVPVPLHFSSRFFRGYNQSQCLVHALGRATQIPEDQLLVRTRRSQSQKSLDRKHRLQNLKQVFKVKKPIQNRHLALVDDVITTGATATVISKILLDAGASRVDVWALARTP